MALQDISQAWAAAQTALARAEARYQAVMGSSADALAGLESSSLIDRLRGEYAASEAEYSEESRLFKDDWPALQKLKSRLDQARLRLELEMQRIAEQVRATAEVEKREALNAVASLEKLLDSQKSAALKLKRDAIEYENLKSEVVKKRETLDLLMARQNEISLSSNLKDLDASTSNVRIVEKASPPAGAFRPRTKINVLIGLSLGLLVGLAMALFLDYIDNTIGTADELRRIVGMPLLAIIPAHTSATASPTHPRRRPAASPPASIDLVAEFDGRTSASEAYRELRTSLLLSHPGKPPRRIMVTSAVPEEGKTATVVNLSVVLSQLGRRVLLIDTDLRRPRLQRVFDVENRQGISTFLAGLEDSPQVLIQPTVVENLDLLTSGPIPPNPSELLNSEVFLKMGEMVERLGYDHVLFDSPPVLSVADPLIIAHTVEVCVLVVRAGRAPRNLVRMAAEKLSTAVSGTLGTVLNDVDPDGYGSKLYKYRSVYTVVEEPKVDSRVSRSSGAGV